MEALVTLTSGKPAALILFRSTEAPMALEPMPASQAKTMFLMGPAITATPPAPAPAPAPVRAEDTELFLPFMASIFEVAALMSPSSLWRVVFRITEATRKEAVAASSTARITPR